MITTDILVPDYDSSHRKSPLVVATFNLSATIIGGGVLSLPLAFAKCGVVLGILLMIVAGVVTERSLYLLCLCARITGATSYGEVGKVAFGKNMEYFISLVLFVFLMFVLVGYMILVRDIWTSIVEIVVVRLKATPNSDAVLLIIVLFMSPFLVQRSLHALRFNCYVGFGSVSILCLALCHHALTSPWPTPLLLWSSSFSDILFAFPIIVLSFMSIYNVLPIQGALTQPSRSRVLLVIDGAVGSCFVLTVVFGLAGYLYAGADTDGNILQNCNHDDDWIFFLGRLGCGITIMLAMPMILLPCRASLLEIMDVFVNGPHVVPVEEEIPLLLIVAPDTNKTKNPLVNKIKRSTLMDNPIIHYVTTFGIATTCYVAAVRAPGVAVVWSLCGSSLAFFIAFILPAACYLKIQRTHPSRESPAWIWFSWALLVASVMASIACTIQTISQFV
jgi:amino acid permease